MIVKQHPEDFQVEELSGLQPGEHGPFAYYRLDKRGLTTPDAARAICRRWRLEPARMAYGGLKDRHARTRQFLTIWQGPRRDLRQRGFSVHYLGQVPHAYAPADFLGNRFRITVRDLRKYAVSSIQEAMEEVRHFGVPNYFDDQRFGSVGPDGRFIARELVHGRIEEALRLAMTAAYAHDRAAAKREKAVLRKHWGDWAACKTALPKGHAWRIVDFLAHHPSDFRRAMERLHPELRGLYLSAFQSYLWNRLLARWLEQHCSPNQLIAVPLRLGLVPMHRQLDEDRLGTLAGLTLPLPAARTTLPGDDSLRELARSVLSAEGLEWEQLKIKGSRKLFFSRGERPALVVPARLDYQIAADRLHAGRVQCALGFELPRGSYATLIVKRITSWSA